MSPVHEVSSENHAAATGSVPVPPRRANPYATGLWVLTGALFLTAFVVLMAGRGLADTPEGMGLVFGTSKIHIYYLASFAVAAWAVLSLLATLVCHALWWRRSDARHPGP